jgi:hypothetical protein
MKKLIVCFLLILPLGVNADFIHPMDFDGSDEQKQRVIEIIKKQVKKDYCESGLDMCQETTLRMMEEENLNAFKKATQAKNRKIMDRVIRDYCNNMLNMCSYANIWMMYEENLKASKKSLSW